MEYNPLFNPIKDHPEQDFYKIPLEADCVMVQKVRIPVQQKCDLNGLEYQQRKTRLQLRKDYVIQIDFLTGKPISCFRCDLDITFKTVREELIMNDEADQCVIQKCGEPIGLEFRSKNWIRNNVFLYLFKQRQYQLFLQSQQNQFQYQEKLNQLSNNVKKSYRMQYLQYMENFKKFCEILGRKYIMQDGFHDIYRAIKKIGKGVTASVYKALRLTDQKQVAVKSFKKDVYFKVDNGRGKLAFQKEFKTMTLMQSKYLCQLIGVFESQNSIYIVMQLLTRSLYSYLRINGFPSFAQSKKIMLKLLLAIQCMHKFKIMHRDLKLENIMVKEQISQSGKVIQPVLIDFGLAEFQQNENFLYVKCGTPGYVAPQILSLNSKNLPKNPYNIKCDIFSLGIIFYILLCHKTVFEGQDEKQVVKKNRQCHLDDQIFKVKGVGQLSENAKDLLKKMLAKEPQERLSASQLFSHSFFKQEEVLEKQVKMRKTVLSMCDEEDNQEKSVAQCFNNTQQKS